MDTRYPQVRIYPVTVAIGLRSWLGYKEYKEYYCVSVGSIDSAVAGTAYYVVSVEGFILARLAARLVKSEV